MDFQKNAEIERDVLAVLNAKTFARVNCSDIAQRHGVHRSRVSRAVTRLCRNGQIEMGGCRWGYYRLKADDRASMVEAMIALEARVSAQLMQIQALLEQTLSNVAPLAAAQAEPSTPSPPPELATEISNTARSEQEAPPEHSVPGETVGGGAQQSFDFGSPDTPTDEKTDTSFADKASRREATKRRGAEIPYEKVLELFRDHLPMLPQPHTVNRARQKAIRLRWDEAQKAGYFDEFVTPDGDPIEAGLRFFDHFFLLVSRCPFLIGRKAKWRADFDWLMKPSNFTKVLEGNYVEKYQEDGAVAIATFNDNDRQIAANIVATYGKAAVDAAASDLIRRGEQPTTKSVLQHLKRQKSDEDTLRDLIRDYPGMEEYLERTGRLTPSSASFDVDPNGCIEAEYYCEPAEA
ncbi:hypothetical protein HW932_20610 [Allochromatium humboldtianum]|uniref:Uncharacterized protein n=1 Tax=Allochromatium humboldtianum TaxID=504901 RepID=A0A850RQ72_9GAMM|nr:hypothetical protein [Allochromatium humboldtianum]NVZ11651.1 hypothetical protein [Allochromatium humboldtianum]